jgi:hypothetical protein
MAAKGKDAAKSNGVAVHAGKGKNTDEQAAEPNMRAEHDHGKGGKGKNTDEQAAGPNMRAEHDHGKGKGKNTDEQAEPPDPDSAEDSADDGYESPLDIDYEMDVYWRRMRALRAEQDLLDVQNRRDLEFAIVHAGNIAVALRHEHDYLEGGRNMAATSSGIAVHEHGKGGKNTDEQAEPESDSEEMGSASPPSMTAAEVAAVEAQWATAVIDGGDDDLMDYMLGD